MKTAFLATLFLFLVALIGVFASITYAIGTEDGSVASCVTDEIVSVVRITEKSIMASNDPFIIEGFMGLGGEPVTEPPFGAVWGGTFALNQADGVVWFMEVSATFDGTGYFVIAQDTLPYDEACGHWTISAEEIAPVYESLNPPDLSNDA